MSKVKIEEKRLEELEIKEKALYDLYKDIQDFRQEYEIRDGRGAGFKEFIETITNPNAMSPMSTIRKRFRELVVEHMPFFIKNQNKELEQENKKLKAELLYERMSMYPLMEKCGFRPCSPSDKLDWAQRNNFNIEKYDNYTYLIREGQLEENE